MQSLKQLFTSVSLQLHEHFAVSMTAARHLLSLTGYQEIAGYPSIPSGASEPELLALEADLQLSLPEDYRHFLSLHRYLKLDDGLEVGGFSHDGLFVTERPWVSTKYREGSSYLVFADYWNYADGDQLMFDLSDPSTPVIAYLHEHGPAFEYYAPSFPMALWRLVHERT